MVYYYLCMSLPCGSFFKFEKYKTYQEAEYAFKKKDVNKQEIYAIVSPPRMLAEQYHVQYIKEICFLYQKKMQ